MKWKKKEIEEIDDRAREKRGEKKRWFALS